MPNGEYTIDRVLDLPAGDPGRIGRIDTLVFFKRGQDPTEMVRVPKEKLDDAATKEQKVEIIKEHVKAYEDRKSELSGGSFTL